MSNTDGVGLVEPSVEMARELRELAEDYARAGEERYRPVLSLTSHDDVAEFVADLRRQSDDHDLPPEQVPQTTYWLWRSDGMLLGTSRLRHHLNPELEVDGGHIGYDVRPSERRKGYGTRILALTLEKARERGLWRVLVTCDDDNAGSARIIERNGGRFQDQVVSPYSGKAVRRYWIELRFEAS